MCNFEMKVEVVKILRALGGGGGGGGNSKCNNFRQ